MPQPCTFFFLRQRKSGFHLVFSDCRFFRAVTVSAEFTAQTCPNFHMGEVGSPPFGVIRAFFFRADSWPAPQEGDLRTFVPAFGAPHVGKSTMLPSASSASCRRVAGSGSFDSPCRTALMVFEVFWRIHRGVSPGASLAVSIISITVCKVKLLCLRSVDVPVLKGHLNQS